MFIIVCRHLVPRGYAAISLFPCIIIPHSSVAGDATLINHEKIHIRQQAEMLVFPFFLWYFAEYLVFRIRGWDHGTAYGNISFEREAYGNEADHSYLRRRRFWGFLKYLKRG